MGRIARLAVWLAIALLSTMCCAETSFAQKRFALVIGNKDYAPSVGPLKNPLNDIDLISRALAQIGFQVVIAKNATRVDINREVSRLATKLGDAGDNAIGFLYYSGHGAARARDRVNYLIPVDVRDMSDEDFWFNAVSLDALLRELESSAPKASQFVIFDACRNELRLPTKGTAKGFEPIAETNGMFIAFSTSPNYTASDIGDVGGPYARALAYELVRPGQDQLTLFQNVKERVFTSTGSTQRPWESNGFVRRVYLAGPAREGLAPGLNPLPGPDVRSTALPAEQPAIPTQLSGRMVRIGVGGPMSGPSGAFGAQIKQGAEQAAEDINAGGGILGQKIALVIGDDRADPTEGISVANKFAGEGVSFVVGHFNSAITIPTSAVYQENGILAISPASTNPRVTERNLWNMFRTSGRDDRQGSAAASIIAARFASKRVAFIHDKTIYGQGLAEDTRKAMNARGLKEILFEGVDVQGKNYSGLVSKLKASPADLVFWGGLFDTGGQILRQMRDQGMSTIFMGGDGLADDEFAAIVGPRVVGTLMTFSPDPRTNLANKNLVQVFRRKGVEPYGYTLYSYAAVQIIKQGAEQANSLDPKKIAAVMHSGKVFQTVLGELSFDGKGDVTGYTVGGRKKDQYVLYVWTRRADGKITFVEAD
jgi:branched-chain amino acid transport system substrate-binding protein